MKGVIAAQIPVELTAAALLFMCALLLCYVFLLRNDMRTLCRVLEQLRVRKCSMRDAYGFRTSAGKALRARLEALQYKLYCLGWEIEHNERSTSAALITTFTTPEFLTYQGTSGDIREFFDQILPKIKAHFRCEGAAFYLECDGCESPTVLAGGLGGIRFRRQLCEFMSEVFVPSGEGLVDGAGAGGLALDFSAFGYRYSWWQSFTIAGRGRAALWLGYKAARPPLEAELRSLSAVRSQLEPALGAFLKFQELGGKMTQAQNLTREKTEVIAHLSHDIRSPLSNLNATLHLLRLEQRDRCGNELIDAALASCTSAAEMVDDLLDYSRHRLGRLETRAETFCLANLASEAAEEFTGAVRSKGLRLTVHIEEGQNYRIKADRRQIKRVVTNLIGNALKYTVQGEILVEVRTRRALILCSVTDTGIGMSQEQLGRLFTPFTRFHSDAAEGIGLGLALSKALVELNQGRIAARSDAGAGSTFHIEFRGAPAGSSEDGAGEIHRSGPSLDGRRVLLVDDDPDCLNSLAKALRSLGCEVETASAASDAGLLIAQGRWSAIVSDLHMPSGGGRKLLDIATRTGSEAPFAVLSGDLQDSSKLKALGAAAIFIKPVDMGALAEFLAATERAPNSAVA